MGFINLAEKTISAKLVYYGCGMGGKTTSLQAVHEIMCPRNEVQLVSIKTEEDATLLFDFLPIDIGEVDGFKIRIQGFTVPGQPKYKRMRKYVLSGADAVVFVVDSQRSRHEENLQSWDSLVENLTDNGLELDQLPVVLQYNKRDLGDILGEDELDDAFKRHGDFASFPSVALEGHGVFETFVHSAGVLVEQKIRQYGLDRGDVDAASVAENACQKLWELASGWRAEVDAKKKADDERLSFELTFDDDGHASSGHADIESSASEGEILSDEDLDIELGPADDSATIDFNEVSCENEDDAEPEEALLEASLESNLELAKQMGELGRYKTLLERKNRELVEMTQNATHDLNKPISALRLMLSSIKKGILGEIPSKVETAVDNGLMAVTLMDRLVNDIVDSTRLDFDGVQLNFQEVDMTLLVAQIVANLRYDIEENHIGVRVEPLPTIVADEWALIKVFMNLVGNAVQYADATRDPRIWVSCHQRDEQWVFQIRDNGIGIPEADINRLFHRFERGSNTGGVSGSGLGLHITREIALGHGGNVWVESVHGEGTTFFLSIPLSPIQPPHSRVSDVDQLIGAE